MMVNMFLHVFFVELSFARFYGVIRLFIIEFCPLKHIFKCLNCPTYLFFSAGDADPLSHTRDTVSTSTARHFRLQKNVSLKKRV